jgi:hypothetical protein
MSEQKPVGTSAPSHAKNYHAQLNPIHIYPTATADPRLVDNNPNAKAEAALYTSGLKKPYHTGRYRPVDFVGGLIILGGLLPLLASLLSSFNVLGAAFNVVYILIGIGIIMRSEMARKIVIFVSAIGLVLNVASLFLVSTSTTGKENVISVLSYLFSIGIILIALSILTWHQAEAEFH